jgi:hypothetical protein
MPYQNISATLSEEDKSAILSAIEIITSKLTFRVNLTNDEKMSLAKMGMGSIAFVEKALQYGKSTPAIVPPYTKIDELQRDFELARALMPINSALNQLSVSIADTTIAVGSEAMSAALSIYNTSREAAKANVPGVKAIYDDLRTRFPGRPVKRDDGSSEGAAPKQ